MDRKIIWIIIFFVIFICGFIFAALSYGEKKTFETDDGREDRRKSEDAQKDYEWVVNQYFIGILIGIIGFILFFELSRYHWIEMGKTLARFEWLHDNEIKKKAIEEVRIQTVLRDEEEPKSSPKVTMKEKMKGLKKKMGVKQKPLEGEEEPGTPALTSDHMTFHEPLLDGPGKPPIQESVIPPEDASGGMDEGEEKEMEGKGEDEHIVSPDEQDLPTETSISEDIESREMDEDGEDEMEDHENGETEKLDVEEQWNKTEIMIRDARGQVSETNGGTHIVDDRTNVEFHDKGEPAENDRPVSNIPDHENEVCPRCQGVAMRQGFGYLKCLECGHEWSD